MGVDFKIKTICIAEKRIKLQMWDTAGQERYRNLTNNYYKGAAGIVLVFAMDNRKSFEDIGTCALTQRSGLNKSTKTLGLAPTSCWSPARPT